MKLASLKSSQCRDGELILVNTALTHATKATDIAPTLQAALDGWSAIAPQLQDRATKLNAGQLKEIFSFQASDVSSPLPRAYQWADGSAYLKHVELVRRARRAEMPPSYYEDPLMYQGGSDSFLGPCDDILVGDIAWGVDFEGETAVIVDDVQMGCTPAEAAKHIKLILLVNDVSLRNLIPAELAKGFGFFQSKPSSAFSPVAVTPDELGRQWDGHRVHGKLIVKLNNHIFGTAEAGQDMQFDFPTLIAHAARTRPLAAGSIIGSGTVSNGDTSAGSACIAERRMIETIANKKELTPFMQYGDHVHIEMLDAQQRSIFGAIDQTVKPYQRK